MLYSSRTGDNTFPLFDDPSGELINDAKKLSFYDTKGFEKEILSMEEEEEAAG